MRLSSITAGSTVEDMLVNIEVAERTANGLLFRNAGVLFFAEKVRRFFPGAYVTCLLAKGTDKVDILDRKDFDKGITTDIEETMRFIERNTRMAYRIKGLRRQNRINFIEKAGTGISRIRDDAQRQGCAEPEFDVGRFVAVTFRPNPKVRPVVRKGRGPRGTGEVAGIFTDQVEDATDQVTEQVVDPTAQVTEQVGLEARLLQVMSGEMTGRGIQEALGLRHRIHFRDAYLLPALQAGLIEMTIPDKPRSSKQRYRLTPAGRERLRQLEGLR